MKLEKLEVAGGGGRRNLETTMASDEVGAAGEVRKQYNHVKGNKVRGPCAILWHVTGAGKSAGTMCVYTATLYYADQDYEDTHPADYLRQCPGFIESYQSVSACSFLIPL